MSGTRPNVGFNPYTPHHAAGRRMLPPESLPSASGDAPAATTAAAPEEEPPGARVGSRGLRVAPVRRALGERGRDAGDDCARGAQARDRSGVAARGGGRDVCRADPVIGQPSTSIQSLTVIGTPSNDPSVPSAIRASLRAASARERSGSSAATAPIVRCTATSRVIESRVSSTVDTSRAASARRIDAMVSSTSGADEAAAAHDRGTGGVRRRAVRPDRVIRRPAGGRRRRRRARTARCRPCERRRSCCVRCSAASAT